MNIHLSTISAILFCLLLTSACSSDPDPCEGVVCINGDCIEGICACEAGYEGTDCTLGSIQGAYQMSTHFFPACNGDTPVTLNRSGTETITCINSEVGSQCTSYSLDFKSEGTFDWIRLSGSRTSTNKIDINSVNSFEGTYTKTDTEVKICPSSISFCFTMTRDGDTLFLSRETNEGCIIDETYTKVR